MFGQDENIGDPCERGIVRHNARKANLIGSFIDAEG